MREFLRVVIVIPLGIAALGAALGIVLREWAWGVWVAWGAHLGLSVFVWFPRSLVPYLRKKWPTR